MAKRRAKVPMQRYDRERGFPCDGVWVVSKRGSSAACIGKLGDLPDPVGYAAFIGMEDVMCEAYRRVNEAHWNRTVVIDEKGGFRGYLPSVSECVRAMLKAVHDIELERDRKSSEEKLRHL